MGVTVRLAGPLRVERGAPPQAVRIGSPKERRLLALLAARRPAVLTGDQLAEQLWDGVGPRHPAAGVATLVSRLRHRLDPDILVGDRGGYRLGAPPDVTVDLDEAAALLDEAGRRLGAGSPGLAASAATRASELLGDGEPLPGEADGPWVVAARTEWRELVRRARHLHADAALVAGDPETARAVATAALSADRFDEAAARLLLAAHQAAGEPARAVADYQGFRDRLADELGVEPAPRTREAYLAVLREQPVVPTAPPTPVTPAARTHRPASGAAASPVVGRTAETARLTTRWERASTGETGVVLVAGEAGIGKTRLVTELAATARPAGARVAVARCHVAERSLFLQPVVDALAATLAELPAAVLRDAARHHARVLAGLFPELADDLGVAEGDVAAPDARRAFEAVGALLRALTATRPMLLVLDDLHNAGRATAELLHHLALRARGARLLVVATTRLEEGATALEVLDEVADRLDLGPLPPSAVTELAGRAGHPELGAAIGRRTRGNALFVVEVLRGLSAGEQGVPASLQAVVQARVRRLGEEVEELLRAAAVLGATVDPDVVARLLGLDPVEAARRCERAAAARMLVVAGRAYEFANDLLHEILYATTPTPTRRLHHRRAADLLTATPEAVAAHALAVEDWPRAARAFLLAGRAAAARGGVGDAETLLDQALDAARRAEETELVGRVHLARARAREGLARFDAAWADLGAAVAAAREAGDRRLEMLVRRQQGGDVPVALGRSAAEMTDRLRDGLALARHHGDRGAEADFRARLAVLATHRLAFTEALDEGTGAVRVARLAGDDATLVVGLDGLKSAYAYLGHVEGLARVVTEMEPLVRRHDGWYLPWVIFEGAFGAVAAGRWDEARDRVGEAVEAGARGGFPAHAAWFVAHLGWVARLAGDLDAALVHGRRAVELSGPVGHPWWSPTARALLATTLLAAGRTVEARRVADEAVAAAGPDAVPAIRLRCLAPLAEATAVPGGDVPPSLDAADRVLAGITAPPGEAWLLGADAYLSVARAWRALGRPDRAGAVVAPLLAAATRHGWRPLLASAATFAQ